ncbi:putative nuclease HARBI1 [Ixodes scapularis]
MHDARVFSISGLDEIIDNLPLSLHVLGDSAYSLRLGLMRPYRNNGHLSEEQVTFNETLSAARSVIERAFAQLKGKFRRLKYLDMEATEMMSKYVLASCVLHNIILQSKEPFVVDNVEIERDDDEPSGDDDQTHTADSRALEKQTAIANFLYMQ